MPMLIALASLLSFTACNDYETYGEKKEKERDAIEDFIRREGIEKITEDQFHEQNNLTDNEKNQFVYLNNSGVYMQIVRPGVGTTLQNGENAELKVRFYEQCIYDTTIVATNQTVPYDPDIMFIQRSGTTYTASFTSGVMQNRYGASVPAGWLVPFKYIKLDSPNNTEDIAYVRLIVPHTQGHSSSSSNVYPYYYELSFQR